MLNILSRKQNKDGDDEPAGRDAAGQLTSVINPLKQCIAQERYGLIASNPEWWKDHPEGQAIFQQLTEAIDSRFALVPEGRVTLAETVDDIPGCPEADTDVEPFLLARHTVTNAQYQKFVDADGYKELDLWPKEMWPHLIDLKDLSDMPGPRFWQQGHHGKDLADHPVVGVCYLEAAAYAKWAGYQLPTEPQWQMAASWRLRSSAHVLRRYPWGDTFDTDRCNVWTCGIGQTVPVSEFEAGAAPNGVLQLVGNVWEWTSSDFNVIDDQGRTIVADMLMKAIRGGAFDTYFAAQATSYFRTGLACLTRAHNVGFRCIMSSQPTGPKKTENEGGSEDESVR